MKSVDGDSRLFVLAFAAQALLVGSLGAVAPKKIVRAGAGIMVSGGVIMAIGAG